MPYKDKDKRLETQRNSMKKNRGSQDVGVHMPETGVHKAVTIEEMKLALTNVPYSPYNVMAEIEHIQESFPWKITLEDRIERAYNYLMFWTGVRTEKIRAYREAQGL
jgi:hypothetical protein